MNTKSTIRFGLLTLAFILVAGCEDSSKLSRSKAEKMIKTQSAYTAPYAVGIPLNGNIRINSGIAPVERQEADINNALSKLQAAELITYNLLSTSRVMWANDYKITVNLLDKSKEYMLGDWNTNDKGHEMTLNGNVVDFSGKGVLVHACDLVFQEVTGISFINNFGQQMAEVEFTDMFTNPTPFSILSNDYTCGKQIGKIQNKRLAFQLYDDGWRIAH